jgi:hypothetical protein
VNKTRITRWDDLNAALMEADLPTAEAMLKVEAKSANPRKQFVLRIHSRINKLRAGGERKQLLRGFK